MLSDTKQDLLLKTLFYKLMGNTYVGVLGSLSIRTDVPCLVIMQVFFIASGDSFPIVFSVTL